ncbi:hypothetical protein D3C78_638290 [compost metagenome]
MGAGRHLVDQQRAADQEELHRQHPHIVEGGDDVLGDTLGFRLQGGDIGRGAGLIQDAAAVPVLHQRQGADGTARAAGQGEGKLPLQRQALLQHAGHAAGGQGRWQLVGLVDSPLSLAVVAFAGRLENGGEEVAGQGRQRLTRQQGQVRGDRHAGAGQEGFLFPAILADTHCAGRRAYRQVLLQQGQGGGRHVLELAGDGIAATGQIAQCLGVVIGRHYLGVGRGAGDAGGIRIQHYHLITEAMGRHHEIAAELAAP